MTIIIEGGLLPWVIMKAPTKVVTPSLLIRLTTTNPLSPDLQPTYTTTNPLSPDLQPTYHPLTNNLLHPQHTLRYEGMN